MKVVRVIGIAMAVLLAAVAVVFLATFDASRFIPQVVAEVRRATGRPLTIRRADLGASFARGLTLELRGAVLGDDPRFSAAPFVTADRISVSVDPWAFLREGRLVMSDVTILAPAVSIIRAADGAINAAALGGTGFPADAGVAAGGKGAGAAAALPAFLAGKVSIADGAFRFVDRMTVPPLTLELTALDITLTGFSLTGPFRFTAAGAWLSDRPNLSARGSLSLDIPSAAVRVQEVEGALALDGVRQDLLEAAFPALGPAGFRGMKGTVAFSVRDARVGAAGLSALDGAVRADVRDLVFTGGNVVAAAFNAIPVKGLLEVVVAQLPEATREDIRRGVTAVERVQVDGRADMAGLNLDPLRVTSRDLAVAGRGTVSMAGVLDFVADLSLSRDLSGALNDKIGGLERAMDSEGRFHLPLTVGGTVAAPRPRVDGQWLTDVFLGKAAEELGRRFGGADGAAAAGKLMDALFGGR